MSESTIYLDYAATSPVDPAVAAAMLGCLGADGRFANPSSTHAPGVAAKRLVEEARRKIADRVDANPDDIVFTSGATESNNLALQGTFAAGGNGPGGLITTRIEHKSVLDTAKALASKGVQVRFVDTDRCGRVSLEHLARLLSEQPARLVSIMHVNNEIGTVQDVVVIARLCNAAGALLHVDAAQSVGKVAVTLRSASVHLCSLTAHKICGPKGIGALYVSPETRLASLLHGGEQERGLRAGTLPTHQIVGMGAAYAIADPTVDGPRITALRERFLEGLGSIDGLRINGSPVAAIPHIVNLCFPGVEGESLRLALRDLAVSAGSACNSDGPEPSYVLKTLGLSDALASSSLRFSFGRFTTEAEVEHAAARVTAEVQRLRALAPSAPGWCSARAF